MYSKRDNAVHVETMTNRTVFIYTTKLQGSYCEITICFDTKFKWSVLSDNIELRLIDFHQNLRELRAFSWNAHAFT